MKSIISTVLFALVLTTGLFAQQTITNEKHERLLTHVVENIFDVQFFNADGDLVQKRSILERWRPI